MIIVASARIVALAGLLACAMAMPQAPGPVMLVEFTFENGFTNTAAGWPGTAGLPVPTEPGTIVARDDDPANHALSMQTYTPDGIAFNVKESFPPNNIDVSMCTEQTISLWYHWPSGSDHQCRPIQEVQHAFALIPPDLIAPDWGTTVSQGSDVNISGAWVHLARVIKIGETGRTYFNGISKAESPSPMTSDDLRWDLTIGYFCENVTLDTIRVYSYALNATQVQALYAEGLPTPSPTAAPTSGPTAAPTSGPTVAPTSTSDGTTPVDGVVETNVTDPVSVAVGDHASDLLAGGGDGYGATDTAMTVGLSSATGDATVTIQAYANRTAFVAVGVDAGCNETSEELAAAGLVVRRFTLTTEPANVSVYASFAIGNDTHRAGYNPGRHVRLCYNGSWMRAEDVCAAVWTSDAVGAARLAAAGVTTVTRVNETTSTGVWICHATPFVLVEPTGKRLVCDEGRYSCDCSMTSRWITDTAYFALVITGGILGAIGLAWWHLANPSLRPKYWHVGFQDSRINGIHEDSVELRQFGDGDYNLQAVDHPSDFDTACSTYCGSGATLFGIGVFLVSAAAYWLRPSGTKDPESEAFSDWTESMGWATVGWTLGSRLLATSTLFGPLAERCFAARDAPGTLSIARLFWSFSLWFPGFAISKSAGYGGGILYTAFAAFMFPAPCCLRMASSCTKRVLAIVDALAFCLLTIFFYIVAPCQ